MPKRMCLIPSCHAEAVGGSSYCFRHGERAREERAESDKMRPSAAERGYDGRWNRLSQAHRAAHPNCQMRNAECGMGNAECGKPGALVDHIEPVATAPERRYDPANLQTLCWGCHRTKTAREKREGKVRGCAGAQVRSEKVGEMGI
jgi:5-methylcytosine-specific restriction protein A